MNVTGMDPDYSNPNNEKIYIVPGYRVFQVFLVKLQTSEMYAVCSSIERHKVSVITISFFSQ